MPAAPDGPSERAFSFMPAPQPSDPSPSDGPQAVLREEFNRLQEGCVEKNTNTAKAATLQGSTRMSNKAKG